MNFKKDEKKTKEKNEKKKDTEEENLVTSSQHCTFTLHLAATTHFTVAEDEKRTETKMEETPCGHRTLHLRLCRRGRTRTCCAPRLRCHREIIMQSEEERCEHS